MTRMSAQARAVVTRFGGKAAREQPCDARCARGIAVMLRHKSGSRRLHNRPHAAGRGKGIALYVVDVQGKTGEFPLPLNVAVRFVAAPVDAVED